jgi:hypothetical protein
VVFQYNKQDLPTDLISAPAEMDDALNFRAVPQLRRRCLHGTGVFETLRGISEIGPQTPRGGDAGHVTSP